jgi:LPS-assembly lipoprotein
MSLSRRARACLVALVLATPLLLAGCTGLRPVYGDAGVRGDLEFSYSEPQSRLEQIVIQDLALRLGRNDSPDSPVIRIRARTLARDLTDVGVTRPDTQYEATVIVSYAISANGKSLGRGSRRASATYATGSQVMANDAAYRDALERAAHEAAEMVRLAILGNLSTPVRGDGDAALDDAELDRILGEQ